MEYLDKVIGVAFKAAIILGFIGISIIGILHECIPYWPEAEKYFNVIGFLFSSVVALCIATAIVIKTFKNRIE